MTLVAVIEWPSGDGEPPTLLFGPTPETLDRMVVDLLHTYVNRDDREWGRFLGSAPFPRHDADDATNLAWLRAMRTALVSTCVDIIAEPSGGSGPGDIQRYQGRYSPEV